MKTLTLLFVAASFVAAQAPDVIQTGTFTGVANGTPVFVGAGGPNGAVVWRLTYFVDGTSITAAQLAIQGADAPNSAGCATASYSTIAAGADIVIESTNPSASGAQGNVALKAYYPCIRARATAVTGSGGTISYQLAGWKFFFNLPITTVPGGTQDTNLIQIGGNTVQTGGVNGSLGVGGLAADGATAAGNPVLIGGHSPTDSRARTIHTDTFGALVVAGVSAAQSDGSSNTPTIPGLATAGTPTPSTNRAFGFRFNGSTWDRDFVCSNQAAFNLSGAGDTEIVPLSGSTVVRICHISFTTAAPEDIKFTQGTGTNCATGTADVSGLYKQVTGLALDFSRVAALRGSAGNAICLNQSGTQALGGIVVFARY